MTVDGKFGKNTKANVVAFQSVSGLEATGNVTTNDWLALWGCKYTRTAKTSGTGTAQPVDYKQYDSKWKSKPYTITGSSKQTISSSGCGPTSMSDIMATWYGFSKFVQTKSMATARAALKEGALVVASMGPGYWTKGGHFICLWKTTDAYMYANDPASSSRTRQKLAAFEEERKQFFIFYRAA